MADYAFGSNPPYGPRKASPGHMWKTRDGQSILMSIEAARSGGKGMIYLSDDIEALVRRVAAARGLSVEDVVARAIEESARRTGITRPRRRQTIDEMLAVGDEIVALPLLDPRSPRQIMDDMNAL
jgi:antitoxin VapB